MEISEQIKRYLLSQHPDFKSPLDPATKTLISVFDIICRNNIPATLSPIRQEQRFRTHHGEYHCTDIHGDIFLLINHVVESGIAKLNIEEPILMYEITPNGQKIQVPFSEDKLHNPDVIVVPNFVINQDFIREDRKFIFHGDLFNRGNQSMECFITMSNLIENYNAAQAGLRNPNSFLKWLTGNHDMDFISTQTIYGNEFIPYTRRQLTFIKAKLSELNQQGNFVFCHYTPETNTLSSHTIFRKQDIEEFLKIIINSDPNSSDLQIARTIATKLANQQELVSQELIQLSDLINTTFSRIIVDLAKFKDIRGYLRQPGTVPELLSKIFITNMTILGLLCYKISPSTIDIAVLCNSIIGHNDSKDGPYSIGDGRVLCLDVGGSCGFNSPLGTYRKKQTSSKLFFIRGEHQFLREVSEIELFEATITRIKIGYGEVFIELPIPQKPISRRERQLEILESELAEEDPITRSPTPCDSVPTRSPTPYDSPPIRLETPIDSTPTGTPSSRQPQRLKRECTTATQYLL